AGLLRALGDGRASGHRVGVTGPPGAGKSTLVSVMALCLRERGRTVGILAVDPSSKRSGGALLGDRARIDSHPEDPGLFVRSLATAGELGGLARSVPSGVMVLAAAFDWVLVETVGVGQSETDVETVVDTVVFVVQPGSGDALQFLKAGIMEIPDIIAVNKSDVGEAARRTRADLRAVLGSTQSAGITGDSPEVLTVSAMRHHGVEELVAAIERHRAARVASGTFEERRLEGRIEWGLREFERRVGDEGIENAGGRASVRAQIAARVRSGGGAL
ncbi:MAG: methylmalonyl Co-A mutase-associated GTPase MeaB, partial [Polyangiaceae bacterium]